MMTSLIYSRLQELRIIIIKSQYNSAANKTKNKEVDFYACLHVHVLVCYHLIKSLGKTKKYIYIYILSKIYVLINPEDGSYAVKLD